MKRIWLVTLVTFAATWMFAGMSFSADSGKAPTEEIIIEGEKKSARFSHTVHLDMGVECAQCHHDSEHNPMTAEAIASLETTQQLRCVSCHNKDFTEPKLQTQKAAFHARCKECHKQGVNGKKGPTKCTDCHVKN